MTGHEKAQVLTVEQAAAILKIGRGTAYEAVRTGEIPSVRVGRCIRIPRAALERMLAGQRVEKGRADGVC